MLCALRRAQELRGVLVAGADLDLDPEQSAQRGQLAGDGRGRMAFFSERRGVSTQCPDVDVLRGLVVGGGPCRELRRVNRVRAVRFLGDDAAAQVVVESLERVGPR